MRTSNFLFLFKAFKKAKTKNYLAALIFQVLVNSSVLAQSLNTTTLTTDRTDYWPGSTAIITGTGFYPGETVSMVVLHYNAATEISICHEPWTVTADNDGNFVTTWFVCDSALNQVLNANADGDASGRHAEVIFTDGSANLDQTRNGNVLSIISPMNWENGNVNGQQAHFVEGYSLPYRMILSGLSAGTHVLDIEWDTKQSDKHALDYITHFKRVEPHLTQFGHSAEVIDPLIGVGLPSSVSIVTEAIPAPGENEDVAGTLQPLASFNSLPVSERLMTMYNGLSIVNIAYLNEDVLTSNQNTKSSIRITFTTNNPTVVFAWGGHIASGKDWGVGNSAGNINGSPYHTRLLSLDGSGGSQDRALAAAAVVPAQCSNGTNPACYLTTNTYTSVTGPGFSYSWSIVANTSGGSIVGPTDGSSVSVYAGNITGIIDLQVTVSTATDAATCINRIFVQAVDAYAGSDYRIGCGETVMLNGSTFISNPAYAWNATGGGHIVSDANTANPLVDAAGDYILKVTDNLGCTATDTVLIFSPDVPNVTISADGPTKICPGASLKLTADGAVSYLWSTGETTASIFVNATGTYSVLGTGLNNCKKGASIEVLVSPYPVITPNGSVPLCIGQSLTLVATGADNYLWSTGETTASITVTSAGIYNVTGTDANGCTGVAAIPADVTVNQLPVISIANDGATEFCHDNSVNLCASGAVNYLWNIQEITECINVTESGTYNVVGTDANGCSASAATPVVIIVYDLPVIDITTIDATIFCEGGSAMLCATGANQYLWNNGATSDCITATVTGDYNVVGTDANGCTATAFSPIHVHSYPKPNITITADGPTALCDGGQVKLTANGAANYIWTPGDATTASITVSESGDYFVTGTSEYNCLSYSAPVNVSLNPSPDCGIDVTTSPGMATLCAQQSGSSYRWSNGGTSICTTVLSAGTYTVTVTSSAGCTSACSEILSRIPSVHDYAISLTYAPDKCSFLSGQETAITYFYIVTNNGSLPASGTITDDNGTPSNTSDDIVVCTWGPLAPNASFTCSFTFQLTGSRTSTATATGSSDGTPVTATASAKVQGVNCFCNMSYPDSSNLPRSMVVFNESEVLRASDPGPTSCGTTGSVIKMWYNDEHALTLGVRKVIIKTAAGSTSTDFPITPTPSAPTCIENPLVGTTFAEGDLTGNDVAAGGGRPLWPALFITDLTVNGPTSRVGDWQQGGMGIPPHRVCGMWKAAVRIVDKTKNPPLVTVTPDANPAKNNWLGVPDAPPGGFEALKNEGYGAEVSWNTEELGLIPGHTYRLQFMVHDGDQNKTGGDCGESCTTFQVPEVLCETPTVSCKCNISYPDMSNMPRSGVVFNENEILRASDPGPLSCGSTGTEIKLWYNDEHALTLGVRRVIVKTATGSTTTDFPITGTPVGSACVNNPFVGTTNVEGDLTGNDVSAGGGRPLWPAIFITDLTVNGSESRAGDWQQGGNGIPPHKVCGTWKGAVRTVDKTKNPPLITVTPDANPAKNDWNGIPDIPPDGFAALKNEGYSAECVWNVDGLGLIAGHTYRLQFMVHDGDQNKTGGDCGQTCTTITLPVQNYPQTVSVSCNSINGACPNGFISGANVMVNNGTAPFTYLWSTGETTSAITHLANGNYSVIVIDALGSGAACNATVAQQMGASDLSSINSDFNGSTISAGNYIWFNSAIKVSNAKQFPVTIKFFNQAISSSQFDLSPPNTKLIISKTVTQASTVFTNGEWVTTVPAGLGGNYFLGGLSYPVPAQIAGGLKNVKWSGVFTATDPNVSVQWSWAGAVYNNFSDDMSLLGVKPVDDGKASIYKNSDKAGTPENYKYYVINGARGGGGSNYTGSLSGSATNNPCNVSTARMTAPSSSNQQAKAAGGMLVNAYPNPFTSSTTIIFQNNKATHSVVEIYTLEGKRIAKLFDEDIKDNTTYKADFNAEGLSSGLYLYKVISDNDIITGKITLLKQ